MIPSRTHRCGICGQTVVVDARMLSRGGVGPVEALYWVTPFCVNHPENEMAVVARTTEPMPSLPGIGTGWPT